MMGLEYLSREVLLGKGLSMNYWWYTRKEKMQMWIAWKLPRWLVKCATIRLIAHTTANSTTPLPEVTIWDVLDRWED